MNRYETAQDRPRLKTRRRVLKTLGVVSLLLPTARSYSLPDAGAIALSPQETAKSPGRQPAVLVRDFNDPWLELLRLLKEAAEIEHSLMLQYLYGAFSVKPAYRDIVGSFAPTGDTLMGIAVQEMQHLGTVNRLRIALGGAPVMSIQDFPYEPDIYPCSMNLEPLTRASLAKYVYAEAPADAVRPAADADPETRRFVDLLRRELGADHRGNHVGSVYNVVIEQLEQFARKHPKRLPKPDRWLTELHRVMTEGEEDHFLFFKSLFLGAHPSLAGDGNPWDLPRDAANYPSRPTPTDPSAYIGHPNQYHDPDAQALAWLGNLHYWSMLILLDLYYRHGEEDFKAAATQSMMAAILPLGMHLPKLGAGLPFDQLSAGTAPGLNGADNLAIARSLLAEAADITVGLQDRLPTDYRFGIEHELIAMLTHMQDRGIYPSRIGFAVSEARHSGLPARRADEA